MDKRAVMNAIFFVFRTGYQWNALNPTLDMFIGICVPDPLGMDLRFVQ
ncbi:hypothetical protein DPD44_22605 [Salmonella enterica subsp. enterica serovar Poona]|nr:hypothetical protein [Salmonella enterica subsp. enterica serovar Poona]